MNQVRVLVAVVTALISLPALTTPLSATPARGEGDDLLSLCARQVEDLLSFAHDATAAWLGGDPVQGAPSPSGWESIAAPAGNARGGDNGGPIEETAPVRRGGDGDPVEDGPFRGWETKPR